MYILYRHTYTRLHISIHKSYIKHLIFHSPTYFIRFLWSLRYIYIFYGHFNMLFRGAYHPPHHPMYQKEQDFLKAWQFINKYWSSTSLVYRNIPMWKFLPHILSLLLLVLASGLGSHNLFGETSKKVGIWKQYYLPELTFHVDQVNFTFYVDLPFVLFRFWISFRFRLLFVLWLDFQIHPDSDQIKLFSLFFPFTSALLVL